MYANRSFCMFLVFIFIWIAIAHAFDANEDIYFELYTNENPENYQVIKNVRAIRSTAFNPGRQTRIFIHGFRSGRDIIKQYAKAFLKYGDFNFIAMNWIDGAETVVYPVARIRVESVSLMYIELPRNSIFTKHLSFIV